jgi:hypothetical protein
MERDLPTCNSQSDPEEEYIEVDAVDDEDEQHRKVESVNDRVDQRKRSSSLFDTQGKTSDMAKNTRVHVKEDTREAVNPEQASTRKHSKLEISHRVERMLHGKISDIVIVVICKYCIFIKAMLMHMKLFQWL